jgi:hypothetical protein
MDDRIAEILCDVRQVPAKQKKRQQMKVECGMTYLQYQIFRCDTLNKKKEKEKGKPKTYTWPCCEPW